MCRRCDARERVMSSSREIDRLSIVFKVIRDLISLDLGDLQSFARVKSAVNHLVSISFAGFCSFSISILPLVYLSFPAAGLYSLFALPSRRHFQSKTFPERIPSPLEIRWRPIRSAGKMTWSDWSTEREEKRDKETFPEGALFTNTAVSTFPTSERSLPWRKRAIPSQMT